MKLLDATGHGFVFLDWCIVVGAVLACLLQLATLRSAQVPDSPLVAAARRIKIVGWALLSARVSFVMVTAGDLLIPIYSAIPLMLLAWGDSFGAMARIWANDERPSIARLVSEPPP